MAWGKSHQAALGDCACRAREFFASSSAPVALHPQVVVFPRLMHHRAHTVPHLPRRLHFAERRYGSQNERVSAPLVEVRYRPTLRITV